MSEHAYDKAWKRYRRLRLHCWLAFAGFGLSGLTAVFADLSSRFGEASLIPIPAFWLYFMITRSRLRSFPRPRCDKEFKRRWMSESRFPRGSCPHCGLHKFSTENSQLSDHSQISRYNLRMNRSAQQVLEDARQLPHGDLDSLIGELFRVGDGSMDAEIDSAWKAEVESRVAESEAGTAVTYSWEEVEAPLRARLAA
jgi:hypothetical protein